MGTRGLMFARVYFILGTLLFAVGIGCLAETYNLTTIGNYKVEQAQQHLDETDAKMAETKVVCDRAILLCQGPARL